MKIMTPLLLEVICQSKHTAPHSIPTRALIE